MSGTLIKIDDQSSWAGGISIDYEPYTFMAGGLYQHVPIPSTTPTPSTSKALSTTKFDPTKTESPKTFTTVFVFARLHGPLVELELATISGITGGFGYNSNMTMPDVTNVTQFPFLLTDLGTEPLAILEKFLTPLPTL